MSAIPSEILHQIFKSLCQGQTSKDLYSCLLVNRHWCSNATVTLWKNPFSLTNRTYQVIDTYLLCLSPSAVQRLNLGNIIHHPNPLFDYPSFLKEFSLQAFCHAIEEWFTKRDEMMDIENDFSKTPHQTWLLPSLELSIILDPHLNDNKFISNNSNNYIWRREFWMLEEIFTMVAGRCSTLDFFSIDANALGIFHIVNLEDILWPFFQANCRALTKTSVLELGGDAAYSNNHHILEEISQRAVNITTLILHGPDKGEYNEEFGDDGIGDALPRFISSLKSLKHFQMVDWESDISEVILALSGVKETLISVEFDGCGFSDAVEALCPNEEGSEEIQKNIFEGMLECMNIESLRFHNVKNIPGFLMNTLHQPGAFPRLRHLKFNQTDDCYKSDGIPTSPLLRIIRNSCSTMESVLIPQIDIARVPGILIILSNCPNLRRLKLRVQKAENFDPLYKFLDSCTKLKKLEFVGDDPFAWQLVSHRGTTYGAQAIVELGRRIPQTLTHLSILSNWSFSPLDLAAFLDNLQCKPKTIVMAVNIFPDTYTQTLVKYAHKVGAQISESPVDNKDEIFLRKKIHIKK